MNPTSLRQYAEAHDVHYETVRLEAKAGAPGFYRVGRKWFWSQEKLLADTIANAHYRAVLELPNAQAFAPRMGPDQKTNRSTRTSPVPSPQPGNLKAAPLKVVRHQEGSGTGTGPDAVGPVSRRHKTRRNKVEPLPDNRLFLNFDHGTPKPD